MSARPLRLRVAEGDFQSTVVQFAQLHGWRVLTIRPAWTEKGWRTPVGGDGRGWPDCTFVRERLVVAELKALGGRLRPEQRDWLAALRRAGVETHVWTPDDWPDIETTLSAPQPPQEAHQ